MKRKKMQFAGSWYPAGMDECRRQIMQFIADAPEVPEGNFFCGIVPHAGWFFSGAVAARVMAALARTSSPELVLLFGMHMHRSDAPRIMVKDGWETPLGPLSVHERFARRLARDVDFQQDSAATFPGDNTIEVQLPLVKYFFPEATLVPVGVPPSTAARDIGRAAACIAADLGIRPVVLGSTDLTHYGENFGFTPAGAGPAAREWVEKENDARAVSAIVSMDDAAILAEGRHRHNMCCAGAVAATVATAKKLGATRGVPLAYANSFDKSPGSSMVGYTGILFGPQPAA